LRDRHASEVFGGQCVQGGCLCRVAGSGDHSPSARKELFRHAQADAARGANDQCQPMFRHILSSASNRPGRPIVRLYNECQIVVASSRVSLVMRDR
jgi:hypothetical protein